MKEIQPILLNGTYMAATAAMTEVDLRKYFVSPGKRELMATLVVAGGVATDTFTFDVKMQQSPTTVDSDFVDITGATFTQVPDATVALQAIFFGTDPASPYLRGYATIAGTGGQPILELFAVKRFS